MKTIKLKLYILLFALSNNIYKRPKHKYKPTIKVATAVDCLTNILSATPDRYFQLLTARLVLELDQQVLSRDEVTSARSSHQRNNFIAIPQSVFYYLVTGKQFYKA